MCFSMSRIIITFIHLSTFVSRYKIVFFNVCISVNLSTLSLPAFLSVNISDRLQYLSVYSSVCVYLSVLPSICLSTRLSVSALVCPSVYLSVRLSYLYVCPSACCLSAYIVCPPTMSLCPPVCLSVCVFLNPPKVSTYHPPALSVCPCIYVSLDIFTRLKPLLRPSDDHHCECLCPDIWKPQKLLCVCFIYSYPEIITVCTGVLGLLFCLDDPCSKRPYT